MVPANPPDHYFPDPPTAGRRRGSATDLPTQPTAASWNSGSSPPRVATRSAASTRQVPDPVAIEAARRSCAGLSRDDPYLARRFYDHLFVLAPGARQMFPPDMTVQTERLFAALLDAVDAMDNPESVRARLRALGAAHARRHHVTEDMYVHVGQALIRAVREVTGDLSTLTASAWASVYQWLADEMIAGARESGHDR